MTVTDTTSDEIEATPEAAPVKTEAQPTGYAIIETGGKQYRVKVGDRIRSSGCAAMPAATLRSTACCCSAATARPASARRLSTAPP